MAFPHQKSGKDNDRNEDKPKIVAVLDNLLRRAINVSEYRKPADNVNPAKNRPFGVLAHDVVIC